MSKKNGYVAIFSAADPGRHSLRWIVIDVSFSKQELRAENNSNTASERSSAKQRTIERPESGALRNPGEGTEIDQRHSQRSTETGVEDIQQNKIPLTEDQREHLNVRRVSSKSKKVAVGHKMTPKAKKDKETSQGSKPGRRKRSPDSERTTSKKRRNSAKQHTIERPESGVSRNPGECTEIDQRGSKRSTERDVEDLQQKEKPLMENQREHLNVWRVNSNSKKVAVGHKMTPKVKNVDTTCQDSKPGKRKKSLYSETTTSKKPRVEGYVRDGPTTSTGEQIDVAHVTPGLSRNVLAKLATEFLSGAAHGSPGGDTKTSSREREFSRSPVTGLTPDDPAYDEGTNTVTGTIVKLWREKVKQGCDKDVTTEMIKKALDFQPEELEELDGKGYNALTKACSLPSVGTRLVSYLLNFKKVDVNSQITSSFNSDSPAARWLTPGMSALSMAIRRGNVNCVPTFMNRGTEIDFRSTDRDQNTALHHCVLSSIVPKTAFDRLFHCYKVLEWKEMKNVQDKSPLDIAQERWMESHTNNDEKKKEALEHVIDVMGFTVPAVNVTDVEDDDDDSDNDDDNNDDDDDDDHNEDVEDDDSDSDSSSDSSDFYSFFSKWQKL